VARIASGRRIRGVGHCIGRSLRLAHIGDTMVPVDPTTLSHRLETAGFDEVEVKKGLGEFRFQAIRAP
jgi:hypothetical protein